MATRTKNEQVETTKLSLNATERIYLPTVFPAQATSLKEMVDFRNIKLKLQLTDVEKKQIEYSENETTGAMNFHNAKAESCTADIELASREIDTLADMVRAFEAQKRVPNNPYFYSFYIQLVNVVPDLAVSD